MIKLTEKAKNKIEVEQLKEAYRAAVSHTLESKEFDSMLRKTAKEELLKLKPQFKKDIRKHLMGMVEKGMKDGWYGELHFGVHTEMGKGEY